MQAILFQVDQASPLVFITSFVNKCVVKFCLQVGKTDAETQNMLCEACGNDACFISFQETVTGALPSESNAAGFLYTGCFTTLVLNCRR
jgi:hypothetical protein